MSFDFGYIDRSSSNAEKYTLREKLFGTEDVIPLWVADMDFPLPPCVVDAINRRLMHPVMGYEIMSENGYAAQIDWMRRHHNVNIDREWLSYSPSVVSSIGCAIRAFTDEGDEIVVQSPVYPPFYSMVKKNGRHLVLNPLKEDQDGKYHFDLEDLKNKITSRTKMLLLCSPHNPVGRVWTKDELKGLEEICLKHDLLIVSDEIHADIVYTPFVHIPTATLSQEMMNRTITLIGPGKTFNMAGFSISTVSISNPKLRKQFHEELERIHWGEGAVLSHTAFEAAYSRADAWYHELLSVLKHNRELILTWSEKYPQIQIYPPEGTYLIWLDCRSLGMGDHDLREFFVYKAKLGLSPGLSFGKEGSGFMRLNIAHSTPVIEQALRQLSDALDRL